MEVSNMELESSWQELQDNVSQVQNKLEQKKHKVIDSVQQKSQLRDVHLGVLKENTIWKQLA